MTKWPDRGGDLMFELKTLSALAIPSALAKAERYRLLNEPEQSQSICEDVLRADPGNHQATVTFILALTDEFPRGRAGAAMKAMDLVSQLPTDYERWYFGGLVAERRGRALLDQPGPGAKAAAEWLREAMEAYERADELRHSDNDEARLRWNACARVFNARPELLREDDRVPDPVTSE